MKNNRKMMLVLVAALSFLTTASLSSNAQTQVSANIHFGNPSWAPPYYEGVGYYYLPDIEAYYDLSDGDFVYLDNGQWLFSPTLPPMYSSYNLSNAFVVALNINVFKPWLHHSYYLSHYPRYYYLHHYSGNVHDIRGFNENIKKPFYWRDGERPREDVERNPVISRRTPEPLHYDGRQIGRPVRVPGHMRGR